MSDIVEDVYKPDLIVYCWDIGDFDMTQHHNNFVPFEKEPATVSHEDSSQTIVANSDIDTAGSRVSLFILVFSAVVAVVTIGAPGSILHFLLSI